MRKSLQKTPPSRLSSRRGGLPGGLLRAVAVGPRAVRRNGAAGRGQPAVPAAYAEPGHARLRLLEGFIGRTSTADCTQLGLSWLAEELQVDQSICLVRPRRDHTLMVVAARGLPATAVASFTVSLDDWSNPLVNVVTHKRSSFFPAAHSSGDRRRRPATPFEDAAFHVVPLGVPGQSDDAFG